VGVDGIDAEGLASLAGNPQSAIRNPQSPIPSYTSTPAAS
jgi:hypothetical protein